MIKTLIGPMAIENIQIGDMVWTLDNGFEEVEYVYRRKMSASGSLAPILFEPGTIGNSRRIIVSPKHRFHVGSLPPALRDQFGGNADTLLQANAFCNGTSVRPYPEIGTVEYIHLLFADHQLIECDGTISESWQPTAKTLKNAPDVAEELLSIFPEMKTRRSCNPGALARHEIKLKDQDIR